MMQMCSVFRPPGSSLKDRRVVKFLVLVTHSGRYPAASSPHWLQSGYVSHEYLFPYASLGCESSELWDLTSQLKRLQESGKMHHDCQSQ
jgi:hypothetical protein